MSQTPITVTYSLEDVLKEINQKLAHIQSDVNDLKVGQAKLEEKVERIETKLTGEIKRVEETLSVKVERIETKLTGEIKRGEDTLSVKIDGIDKRLSNQEFFNRGILVALIVALIGSAAKLFGLVGNP